MTIKSEEEFLMSMEVLVWTAVTTVLFLLSLLCLSRLEKKYIIPAVMLLVAAVMAFVILGDAYRVATLGDSRWEMTLGLR